MPEKMLPIGENIGKPCFFWNEDLENCGHPKSELIEREFCASEVHPVCVDVLSGSDTLINKHQNTVSRVESVYDMIKYSIWLKFAINETKWKVQKYEKSNKTNEQKLSRFVDFIRKNSDGTADGFRIGLDISDDGTYLADMRTASRGETIESMIEQEKLGLNVMGSNDFAQLDSILDYLEAKKAINEIGANVLSD